MESVVKNACTVFPSLHPTAIYCLFINSPPLFCHSQCNAGKCFAPVLCSIPCKHPSVSISVIVAVCIVPLCTECLAHFLRFFTGNQNFHKYLLSGAKPRIQLLSCLYSSIIFPVLESIFLLQYEFDSQYCTFCHPKQKNPFFPFPLLSP